ncbi:MAG: sigma-70 family RNA polymerase sigma factor [Planctomycetes bacterium]|nr:sigma-70 family RNA polymerase sigma factor [Planctomycetota bacterium]
MSESSAVFNQRFTTTRWSLVLAAAHEPQDASRAALSQLCMLYWYPLYAFVRRKGVDAEDARDLTQSFFARLIEKHDLSMADPDRGRFRSFLLSAMTHFLLNHWRSERAIKRGGGQTARPLDFNIDDGESRYRLEPSHDETAERVFERGWAMTVLEAAMNNLKSEMAAAGKIAQFEALRIYMDGATDRPYSEAAEAMGMTDVAVRVAVHRMREKFRRHLRGLIAETVASEAEVDREIRQLMMAVQR